MPAKLRLNGLTEKFILKQIARNQVPATLIDRAKQPYRAPISHCFLNANPPEYVSELLSKTAIKHVGYFEPAKVQQLIGKCKNQNGNLISERENMALVAILSTQLVDRQFIQNFPDFSTPPLNHTIKEHQAA